MHCCKTVYKLTRYKLTVQVDSVKHIPISTKSIVANCSKVMTLAPSLLFTLTDSLTWPGRTTCPSTGTRGGESTNGNVQALLQIWQGLCWRTVRRCKNASSPGLDAAGLAMRMPKRNSRNMKGAEGRQRNCSKELHHAKPKKCFHFLESLLWFKLKMLVTSHHNLVALMLCFFSVSGNTRWWVQ